MKAKLAAGLTGLAVISAVLAGCSSGKGAAPAPVTSARSTSGTGTPTSVPPTTVAPSARPKTPISSAFTETAGAPGLSRIATIGGHITPKSVAASGTGLVFAQNMIYSHTITVYNRDFALVKTIQDTVDLASFGVPGHPGISRGGPVEAAFTPDAKYVYVSNYSMYGSGFPREGHDTCSPRSGFDSSTVYRINVATLTIDQVIPVGVVPKFLEVTPDGRHVVVSNWCSYAVSIIDTATAKEVKRIPVGAYPRGIAISPDSKIAYIAIMGGSSVVKINMSTYQTTSINGVGSGPRHLVLDPTARYLYATLNGAGIVVKIDLTTGRVVARAATGHDPRSMAMSADGQFLYVVNYFSSTMTKLRTSDFVAVQTVRTNQHPIGITVDKGTGRVWVADYGGTIEVFADRR